MAAGGQPGQQQQAQPATATVAAAGGPMGLAVAGPTKNPAAPAHSSCPTYPPLPPPPTTLKPPHPPAAPGGGLCGADQRDERVQRDPAQLPAHPPPPAPPPPRPAGAGRAGGGCRAGGGVAAAAAAGRGEGEGGGRGGCRAGGGGRGGAAAGAAGRRAVCAWHRAGAGPGAAAAAGAAAAHPGPGALHHGTVGGWAGLRVMWWSLPALPPWAGAAPPRPACSAHSSPSFAGPVNWLGCYRFVWVKGCYPRCYLS